MKRIHFKTKSEMLEYLQDGGVLYSRDSKYSIKAYYMDGRFWRSFNRHSRLLSSDKELYNSLSWWAE
jgi:hypothetical protein